MFEELLLHPKLNLQLTRIVSTTPHGILLIGPNGSGKFSLSQKIAAATLKISESKLKDYPYLLMLNPSKDTISIDDIRELQQFLKLKVPGKIDTIKRIIIINHAERMRTEAQNAILKTLEEPPLDTIFILTALSKNSLLPTITSRVMIVPVLPISSSQAIKYYSDKGIPLTAIRRAHALSQGQAGLLHSLLNTESHHLDKDISFAKQILSLTPTERLLLVENLSKDKPTIVQLLEALQRITHAGLTAASSANKISVIKNWQSKQSIVLSAIDSMRHNPNLKLMLDDLFLNL